MLNTVGFLVLQLLLHVPSASTSSTLRHRRSDDSNPLETVVATLSQQVNTLTAELAALKTKTANLEKTVAFNAWHDTNPIQTSGKGAIILNHVLTNIGNAYSPSTGIFTVPVSGLYDIQATFMGNGSPATNMYASLFVNGQQVAEGVSDSRHGFWDQTTISSIVHLTAGQQVYLGNPLGTAASYYSSTGQPYTTFSGFLIKAD